MARHVAGTSGLAPYADGRRGPSLGARLLAWHAMAATRVATAQAHGGAREPLCRRVDAGESAGDPRLVRGSRVELARWGDGSRGGRSRNAGRRRGCRFRGRWATRATRSGQGRRCRSRTSRGRGPRPDGREGAPWGRIGPNVGSLRGSLAIHLRRRGAGRADRSPSITRRASGARAGALADEPRVTSCVRRRRSRFPPERLAGGRRLAPCFALGMAGERSGRRPH
jgi:hypothetical protein